MATSTATIGRNDHDAMQAVRQFNTIAPWVADALDVDKVLPALNRHVPEFASRALTLRDCAIDLLHLKGTTGMWERNWTLSIADANGERRMPLRVTLLPPGTSPGELPATTAALDSSDWQCWLPELGLLC